MVYEIDQQAHRDRTHSGQARDNDAATIPSGDKGGRENSDSDSADFIYGKNKGSLCTEAALYYLSMQVHHPGCHEGV